MKAILCPHCKWSQITVAKNSTKCQKCEKMINLTFDKGGYARIKVLKNNFIDAQQASFWIKIYRQKLMQEKSDFFNYIKKS